MIEPIINEEVIAQTDPRIESATRATRTNVVLCALGAGLAIGLLVRALRPDPTPRQRVADLLADLEDRLRDTTHPALRKATAYASDRAAVVRDGLHTGEALLERCWRDTSRSLRKLFS